MKQKNDPSGLNKKAYLGKLAQDLLYLSSDQVVAVYAQRGLLIPVEVSSTLSYLGMHEQSVLADLAHSLDIPHQLVAQRVAKLAQLGLLIKRPDQEDRRRSYLELSATGIEQAKLLQQCMEDMAVVYEQLYQEIGCDLPAKLQAAIDALKDKNLSSRFKDTFPTGEQP